MPLLPGTLVGALTATGALHNLAATPINDRWTKDAQQRSSNSRREAHTLVTAIFQHWWVRHMPHIRIDLSPALRSTQVMPDPTPEAVNGFLTGHEL